MTFLYCQLVLLIDWLSVPRNSSWQPHRHGKPLQRFKRVLYLKFFVFVHKCFSLLILWRQLWWCGVSVTTRHSLSLSLSPSISFSKPTSLDRSKSAYCLTRCQQWYRVNKFVNCLDSVNLYKSMLLPSVSKCACVSVCSHNHDEWPVVVVGDQGLMRQTNYIKRVSCISMIHDL